MLRAYRFQLRLKPPQEAQLRRFSGMARWVWNRALAEQKNRHENGEKYASYVVMCQWLTAWRQAPDTRWLSEGPAQVQQQVLRRLDVAYQCFFARVKAGHKPGFPKFKRRGQEPGLRFPDPKQFELDSLNQRIQLPKIGWVRLRLSCDVAGTLKNASMSRSGDHWFCAIQVEVPDVAPAALAPTLGIDLGLRAFAATSEGRLVEPLAALAHQQVRLRRYQRSVSRKAKGSCNRKKAINKLAALHRRIARQRADWLHKLTHELANQHPVIAIEDLRVAAMSASARDSLGKPDKTVRQKADLNRAILDAAWAEFRRQLDYKLAAHGGRVIAVNPPDPSLNGKLVDPHKADIQAAKNILAAGHAVWLSETSADACGGVVRRPSARKRTTGAAPAKQEPSEAIFPD